MAGRIVIDPAGWRLVPGHFAERHGLIIIIALGESIVAIGTGAGHDVDAAIVLAAVLGVVVAAALWWLYFDVVALVSTRRLVAAADGLRAQPHGARLVLLPALPDGRRHRARRAGDEGDARARRAIRSQLVPTAALLGGAALYLLAHVAFRLRNVHTLNRRRLGLAIVLLALIPALDTRPALVPLGLLAGALTLLIAYETRVYGEARQRVRHPDAAA